MRLVREVHERGPEELRWRIVRRNERMEVGVTAPRWSVGRWSALIVAILVLGGVIAVRTAFTVPYLAGSRAEVRQTSAQDQPGIVDQLVFQDFRDTVWLPVQDLVRGGNPYDAPAFRDRYPQSHEFTYLPAQLVVFLPLGLLPWSVSSTLWFVGILLCAVLLARLSMAIARLPARWDVLAVTTAAFLLVRPFGSMLLNGQTSIVPLLGSLVALHRRRDDTVTAVCVALSWLKPQFGLPITVLLLVAGPRRPAVRGTLLAALVSLPIALWAAVNAGGIGPFVASLPTGLSAAVTEREADVVMSDMSSLIGSFTHGEGSLGLVLACLVVVLGLGAVTSSRLWHSGRDDLALVVAITTTLLALQHGPYDYAAMLPLLMLAVALSIRRGTRPRTGTDAMWLVLAVTIGFTVLPRAYTAIDSHELLLSLGVVVAAMLTVLPATPERRRYAAGLAIALGAGLALRYVPAYLAGNRTIIDSGLVPASFLALTWVLAVAWYWRTGGPVSEAGVERIDAAVPAAPDT